MPTDFFRSDFHDLFNKPHAWERPMRRTCTAAMVATLLGVPSVAPTQSTPTATLAFDVASIKESPGESRRAISPDAWAIHGSESSAALHSVSIDSLERLAGSHGPTTSTPRSSTPPPGMRTCASCFRICSPTALAFACIANSGTCRCMHWSLRVPMALLGQSLCVLRWTATSWGRNPQRSRPAPRRPSGPDA